METESIARNHRILIVDDTAAIHEDFKKIMVPSSEPADPFDLADASLFGSTDSGQTEVDFEVTSAYQGEEAVAAVREAVKAGRPFAMAFVDVRMPPGMDGIETTEKMWQADPDLQIIICTAYSDHSWKDIRKRLGATDSMVILKKPFDSIEVLQMASALAEKWRLLKESKLRVRGLEHAVGERTRGMEAANEELRGTQQKLKNFLARNPAVLYSLKYEAEGWIPLWVGDNFASFTGFEIKDWYRPTEDWNFVEAEDRQRVSEGLKTLLFKPQLSLEYRIHRRDGTVRWVRDDCQLLRDAAGQPVEVAGCWTDITERKQLEDQLHQSQKMEAFGQLAGGVAHDFNNLLTIIQGYVCVLQRKNHAAEERSNCLAAIAKATDRAANLTRQLLTFTRRQLFQPKPVDLNEVIAGTSQMIQKLIGESIAVETRLLPGGAGIKADHHMLEQTLINLAANARDAMPNGGKLVLTTSYCDRGPGLLNPQGEIRQGPHICLSCADTGSGIAAEHLPRIFEPFFTTKDVGKGTGLGLASVYGIVKQHQGWIEVSSEVGKGTAFRIYFPAFSPPAATAGPSNCGQPACDGSETILVVEDEPALRELFLISLQNLGYKVFTEGSGIEALRAWSSRLDQIDLLLTDIVMPGGVSGWDLVKTLQARKPQLRVVYMSGHNTDFENLESSTRLLAKPFDPQTLAVAVRNCLDERKGLTTHPPATRELLPS
jgi:PAS domain S-box-containing protein